jgi:hypothetical protein
MGSVTEDRRCVLEREVQLHYFIAGKSEELSSQPVVVRPEEGPQIDQAESQPPRVNLALLRSMSGTPCILRVLCLASLSTNADVTGKYLAHIKAPAFVCKDTQPCISMRYG